MTIRVYERSNGDIVIQKRKWFFWITLHVTQNPTDALYFLDNLGVKYTETTGYYK